MSACLQGILHRPSTAAPLQLLWSLNKLCVRPWAQCGRHRAVPSIRAHADAVRLASSSTASSGERATEVLLGRSAEDVAKLPSTAYGRVMSSQANYFRVRLNGTAESGETVPEVELLCKARSLMHKMGKYVLVGDTVTIINIDWRDNRGLVAEVQPRTSEIMNPKMANVDHFALVFALADPPPEAFQITRFLVSAESVGVPCSILLNKADLVSPEAAAAQVARIRTWGYHAIPISVESGQGMADLKESLGNRCTVLAGPSGVGKSSIINALRSIAFDDKQKRRLETFAEQMATEYDWRNLDADYDEAEDASDGESDSDEDSRPDASSGAGVRQQPQAAESPRHESQATGSGQSSEAASGAPPGVPGSAVPQGSRSGVEAPTEEAVVDPLALTAPSWMKRNADIYGAQAVGNVGLRSRRGRHTTRCTLLLDIPGGGLLADTPGFNYPSLAQVSGENVQAHFPEIALIQAEHACSFANCTHLHEPGCSVQTEPWERYEFYVRLREEVMSRQKIEDTKLQMQKRRRQGQTKTVKRTGGVNLETARLDPKKHRRVPRTERKLQIRDIMENIADDA